MPAANPTIANKETHSNLGCRTLGANAGNNATAPIIKVTIWALVPPKTTTATPMTHSSIATMVRPCDARKATAPATSRDKKTGNLRFPEKGPTTRPSSVWGMPNRSVAKRACQKPSTQENNTKRTSNRSNLHRASAESRKNSQQRPAGKADTSTPRTFQVPSGSTLPGNESMTGSTKRLQTKHNLRADGPHGNRRKTSRMQAPIKTEAQNTGRPPPGKGRLNNRRAGRAQPYRLR